MSSQAVHILLVEDDEVDIEATYRAFDSMKIANALTVAQDGIEALDRLRGTNGYERLPRPYIILLDINMPRMNGLEFLDALREDAELKASIVFVLTTSSRQEDMLAAYNEQVAGYFLKTKIGHGLLELPKLLKSYWRIVEFPPDRPA